jgi:tape measure domain-containing protein
MATSKQRDVEVALRVTTAGGEAVSELVGDVQALAGEGQSLGTALKSGAAGADTLTAELTRLAAVTKENRAAEAAASAEVARTKRTLDEQRDALARLRATYAGAGGDATKYKTDVAALRVAIVDSGAALRDKRTALSEASTAAKSAAAAEQQLAAQVRQAGEASKKTAADVSTVGKSASDTAGILRQLGPLIAGAFSAQQFVQVIASSESLHRSFEQIFGSAGRAAEELAFVKDTANRLGLENLALAKSYQSISAATRGTSLEGEQTRAVFEAIVRAMATLGKSSAETERALVAVSQIASKGTASMEELRGQLGEALPGAMQAAAKGAGITVEQLTDMVSSGHVLASDILPALTKGLNDLYGKAAPPDNIISNWARLKNVLTDTAVAVGEGGASTGLAKALSGAAIAVQGASAEVDILGTGLGELVAAVVTGNHELGTGEEVANKYADALRRSAETAGFAEKSQAELTSAQQQGNQTAGEAFRALERLAQKQQQTGDSLLKIKAVYGELVKGSNDYTEQLGKEAAARASEGAALTQLVNLYGTETEKRRVLASVAEMQYAAAQRLAQAREVEAIVAQSLSIKLQEEALRRNDTTEATRKEIEAAQKSAASKNAEAEQSKASAAAKRIEVEATKASALAYQENTARVYEFRAAAAEASREVARLTELQKQGKATDEQVAEARVKAAGATRLYRDALADASAAAQRRVTDEQQLAQAEQAAISLEVVRVKSLREVADANGDAVKSGQLLREETNLQVQAAQAQADASRREAQAIREAASAREAELRATGELTAAKAAEIESARRSADLKDIEAQKADILAQKTRDLANSEQARTAGLEKQIEVQEKAIQLAERQRALDERKRTAYDTAGNVVNAQGETLTSIINTLKGYGLDEAKARELAKPYINPNGQVNYGAGNSLGGSTLSDTLRILAEKTLSSGPKPTLSQANTAPAPAAPGNTQPASPATGGSRTVNINIGGLVSAVNVASQADSDTLVKTLKLLGNARATAV